MNKDSTLVHVIFDRQDCDDDQLACASWCKQDEISIPRNNIEFTDAPVSCQECMNSHTVLIVRSEKEMENAAHKMEDDGGPYLPIWMVAEGVLSKGSHSLTPEQALSLMSMPQVLRHGRFK